MEGVALNPEKCKFSVSSLQYFGYIIDSHGIPADPAKIDAALILEGF